MNTVHIDPPFGDRRSRDELYAGQIILRSPSPATRAFVDHARAMIETAFAGMDPRTAQYKLSVESFVDRFAPLKHAFIHDERSLSCIAGIMHELGCDPDDTYIDVPRLRVATSDGYLTSGVAYAHHAHRDTWYSAPMAQINRWMPVYPYESSASMAFHPAYWSQPVRNSSGDFDYYRWNAEGRAQARSQIGSDTRKQPRAQDALDLEPEVRFVLPPASVIAFSAAQLHSTCKNVSGASRWSVDFRTVSLADLEERRGAANVDSAPTGTSLRDFVRLRDFTPMPEATVRKFDDRENVEGQLVFRA